MNETFAGCQGDSDAIARADHPLSKMPPAPAPEGLVPASGAIFSPAFPLPWIRERAELLHRLFTRVVARREQGLSLAKALRHRWYGPRYHAARRIKVRQGTARLKTLYYDWCRNGKTPGCLVLRFPSKLPPVPAEVVYAFVAACSVEGVTHFSQAFRLIDSEGLSFHRVQAALPDQVLRIIRQTFAARRQAKIEAPKRLRELQGQIRQTQWQIRRVLAPAGARDRRLKRLVDLVTGRRGCGGIDSTFRRWEAPIQPNGTIFKAVLQEVSKRVSTERQYE